VLRGKCAKCGGGISFRYFAVELLTAVAFLLVWIQCDRAEAWVLVFPLWALIGLLIAATFIDLDHFIIPDEITLGGTAAGLILSAAIPSMMGVESHWMALLWSAVGAATGYGLLWGVVELGKLAFGKRKLSFDPPAEFVWTRHGEDADFVVGEEKMLWSDIFSRDSDRLVLETVEPRLDEETLEETTLQFHYNRLLLPGREVELETVSTISGKVGRIVIPREAMGFGDVKFIACIGAFLGWKAVLFTVVSASVFGSVLGMALILLGRREASGRIPFGPYLALGATLWIFAGPAMIEWYLRLLLPAPPL
jgi:leader peptidase (prepilin peptidase)/N-methyltransferase